MKQLLIWAWNLAMAGLFIFFALHFKTNAGINIGCAVLYIGGLIWRIYQLIKSGDPDNYWPEILIVISTFLLGIIGSEIWTG